MGAGLFKNAFLAGSIAFFAVFGPTSRVCGDEIEDFLNAPGIVEKFEKAKGAKSQKTDTVQSPLVTQAKSFALYLNPPTPVAPKTPSQGSPKPSAKPRPAKVSAKFDLIGTSFYVSDPPLSLALIDEPGTGLRWIRQAGKVGHLVIDQIKDGLIVVRDGADTFELEVPKKQKINLLKNPTDKEDSKPADLKAEIESVLEKKDTYAQADEVDHAVSEEENNLMEQFMARLKAGGDPNKVSAAPGAEKRVEIVEDLITQLQSMRISKEESNQLEKLGEELKEIQQDANQPKRTPILTKPRPARTRTSRTRK